MHGLSDRLIMMHWQSIFLVQVGLRTEVPRTPSLTRPGLACQNEPFNTQSDNLIEIGNHASVEEPSAIKNSHTDD